MFDTSIRAKERLLGLAAIGAILGGGALAVDLMVTGGFDFAPSVTARTASDESAYLTVLDAAQYVSDRFDRLWAETVAAEAHATPLEDLDGADDGSPALIDGDAPPTGDELYAEIRALYEESEPSDAMTVEQPLYDDASANDEVSEQDDKPASVSESG